MCVFNETKEGYGLAITLTKSKSISEKEYEAIVEFIKSK